MRYHLPIYVLCVSSHFWPFSKVNFVFANFKKSWSSVRPPPLVGPKDQVCQRKNFWSSPYLPKAWKHEMPAHLKIISIFDFCSHLRIQNMGLTNLTIVQTVETVQLYWRDCRDWRDWKKLKTVETGDCIDCIDWRSEKSIGNSLSDSLKAWNASASKNRV